MKRLLFLVVAMAVMYLPVAAGARSGHRVGVLIFSEEVRYQEAQKGMIDQLREDGFGEPATSFTIENAGGSKAKAAEMVQKLAAGKMDLILTLGTSATIAAAREIKDVPIVFAIVYDPVAAKLARDWDSSGNNITGASPRFPMQKLISTLKDFAPVKGLAVLYTPGEKNSELQLKELQALQADSRIKVIPVILSNKEDVAEILPEVARKADAIFLTGSSIVGATVPIIVNIANRAKVVTLSHLDDMVGKGALLGMCANSYRVGRLAGKKAVRILKGAKPSSIPIKNEQTLDIILNLKTAKAGKFQIPPKFMKTVTKTIE